MKNTVSHQSWLKKYLADPEKAAAYLNAELEDGDMFYLLKAIRNVAAANGGVGKLAKTVKMSRTTLYKTLSENGNPGISTLEKILAVYGLRIGFFPVSEIKPRNSRHSSRHNYGNSHHPAP